MIDAYSIPVTKIERSKLNDTPLENIPFGKYFTDHMLEADYINGEWTNVEIKPYQPLLLSPSLAAIHYGQSIFEGIKAYRNAAGEAFIFRPHDNFSRFNLSAKRMQMPEVPEEIFIEGMRQLIELDKNWIPNLTDHSLYIRPFMFSSDEVIGVKASDTYKFMIILSPTGPYYSTPVRIYVEEVYTRAAPGGIGFVKAAGNYGASMAVTAEARRQGYDQVLWTDAFEHKYAQEIGTMNVFFVTGKTILTPDLEQGTILNGVTRSSAITIFKEMGYKVEERPVNIEEMIELYKKGELQEVFGTGTAATISPIKELKYKDFVMTFNVDEWKAAPEMKRRLTDIREGRAADNHGWLFKV
ncbi:branched-chain amino acid aminotransferase [Pseudoflavitalea sp. G-6-1-2]|uniref:branched-chain amino acid aminotransferase n=1 Tax=Pseudoflavitalea sp. G-6-1-2 TaxID=2728841 RepID=UPI00146DCBA4|nr:branched-chain amino acid aminotransferase [Pseudoflavitalea sp. G-6-1-2]NML23045.1 branched-chain amino acid aminotransferase [Pseudoflavitalea sp. G-6-1-2]